MKPAISVIVPVYREAAVIGTTLDHLFCLPGAADIECIVVDGSPQADTLDAVSHPGVKKVRSPRGRGMQMNRGAALARAPICLFLHADTRLPSTALAGIQRILRGPSLAGGAFDLGIDSPKKAYRLIEGVASLRSRLTRIPYGDQAIFIRKNAFCRLGGYRTIPLMEDVDLMRRLKRAGLRIAILNERVSTSPRRWEKEGALYCTLRNWTLMALYLAGWPVERLAKYYR
jgi:rSAM/selenodomain-associated transferase 2